MKKKLKKNLNPLLKAMKLNLIIEERELKNKKTKRLKSKIKLSRKTFPTKILITYQ